MSVLPVMAARARCAQHLSRATSTSPLRCSVASSLLTRVPAWTLAVTAILSVPIGAAISVGLFSQIGVACTASVKKASDCGSRQQKG